MRVFSKVWKLPVRNLCILIYLHFSGTFSLLDHAAPSIDKYGDPDVWHPVRLSIKRETREKRSKLGGD
jgi:hypothetical protein